MSGSREGVGYDEESTWELLLLEEWEGEVEEVEGSEGSGFLVFDAILEA